jgi:Cys-Gly metallodipeptidase DUG1
MTDLIHIMSRLVLPNGQILIPGIMDKVAALTPEEQTMYNQIDFQLADLEESLGSKTLIYDEVPKTLMHRWRYPSLSLHG